MTTLRVLVIDDDAEVRDGIRSILEAEPDFVVVGEASSGIRGAGLATRLQPHLAVVDMNMPGMSGAETTKALREAEPTIRVLILTAFSADDSILAALHAGASGYLFKDLRPGQLPDALRRVFAGETVLADEVTRTVISRALSTHENDQNPDAVAAEQVALLTERERDLAIAVGSGLTNAEIAAQLFISPASVKTYMSRILDKLALSNRTQLAILVHRADLLQ